MELSSKIKESDILIRYIAKETSNEENDIIQQWLDNSPENVDYYMKVKRIWDETNEQDEWDKTYETSKTWDKLFKTTTAPSATSHRLSWWISIAASVFILLGICFYFLWPSNETIYTSSNKTVKIILPDNSLVWLNRNSTLAIKKDFLKKRSLTFSGEGYFEVQPDPSHPFMIFTHTAKVTVIGTKFNVRANPGDTITEVVVLSGKVSLSQGDNPRKEIILQAGEKGVNQNLSGGLQKAIGVNQNYLSWKTREFVFNNTNITEIVKIIEKVYNTKTELISSHPENCNLSGKFNCQSLDDMLDMLKMVLNVSVEKKEGMVVIKGDGCQ
jgi:transmembrane sensor